MDFLYWDEYSYIANNSVIFLLLYSLFWPIVTIGSFLSLFSYNANQVACMNENPYCMHVVLFSIIPLFVTYCVCGLILGICITKKEFSQSLFTKIEVFSSLVRKNARLTHISGSAPFIITIIWIIGGSLAKQSILLSFFEVIAIFGWNIFFISFLVFIYISLKDHLSKVQLGLVLIWFTVIYLIPVLFIMVIVLYSR